MRLFQARRRARPGAADSADQSCASRLEQAFPRRHHVRSAIQENLGGMLSATRCNGSDAVLLQDRARVRGRAASTSPARTRMRARKSHVRRMRIGYGAAHGHRQGRGGRGVGERRDVLWLRGKGGARGAKAGGDAWVIRPLDALAITSRHAYVGGHDDTHRPSRLFSRREAPGAASQVVEVVKGTAPPLYAYADRSDHTGDASA